MRREDVAPALHAWLVPVEGRPHVLAMRAPPSPRLLPPGGAGRPDLVAAAMRALGELAGSMRHWDYPDMLTRTLARREAVQSSQIEGTRTDLDQLLRYEATRSVEGLPADVRETERYVRALQLGLEAVREGGRAALGLALVHALHAELMADAPGDLARGAWRSSQAYIGQSGRIEDARFVPSPPADIEAAMRDLEANGLQYAPREDEQGALSEVLQVAIVHAQFETIHPYQDGNGRTGRLLMPLLLAATGLPPLYLSGVLLRDRAGYYDALLGVQLRGDWAPWVEMVCRALVQASQDARQIASDLGAMVVEWRRVLGARRDSAAFRLVPQLIGHPTVTANGVGALLGVSHRAALTGIYQLEQAGVVSKVESEGRAQAWRAAWVIDRLNRLPAEE